MSHTEKVWDIYQDLNKYHNNHQNIEMAWLITDIYHRTRVKLLTIRGFCASHNMPSLKKLWQLIKEK